MVKRVRRAFKKPKSKKVCLTKKTGWLRKGQGSSYFRYKKPRQPSSGVVLVKRRKRKN